MNHLAELGEKFGSKSLYPKDVFYRPCMREGNVFILCVCVCVSVQTITFECLEIETSFLVW